MPRTGKPRKASTPGPKKPKGPGRAPSKKKAAAPAVVEGEVVEAADPDLEAVEPSPDELEPVEVGNEVPAALVKPESRAISSPSRDPMQAYMAEVTRHPLLTREQEH